MGNWLYLICIISCICKVVLGDVSDEGLCLQPGVRFLVARLLSPWRDRCDWVMRPSRVWCQSLQAELVQRWVRRGHFLVVDSSSNVHIETLPHFPSSGWWALRHPYLICRRTEEEVEGTPLYERTSLWRGVGDGLKESWVPLGWMAHLLGRFKKMLLSGCLTWGNLEVTRRAEWLLNEQGILGSSN